MKKKKKTKIKRKQQAFNDHQEEVEEELLALNAIFGDDFKLADDDDHQGFTLRVVPHPGEAEVNYVSVVMNVTFPKHYPEEEVHLKLTDAQGLKDQDVKAISKSLHNAAYSYSVSSAVCCFQLVQLCQELLQSLNQPDNEQQPQSLWHTMQQRELEGANERSLSGPIGTDVWGAAESFEWLNTNSSSGLATTTNTVAASKKPVLKPPLPPSKPTPFDMAPNTKPVISGALQTDNTMYTAAGPSTSSNSQQQQEGAGKHSKNTPTVTHTSSGSQLLDPSGSLGHSFSTVLRTIGAIGHNLLPRSLQSYLKKGPSTDEEEEPVASSSSGQDDEQEELRKDMLLGHLIRKASVEDRALNAIAAMLQRRSLVPQWLYWTLTQQPVLFDRAFKRVFARELAESTSDTVLLGGFWRPDPPCSKTTSAAAPGLVAGGSTLASRYKADFSEERRLGQGGYGLVLLATNRIDGRQYAIKKIPLSAASPHAYARIMREVTTLSRLHHSNVVRYYNSWVEEEEVPDRKRSGIHRHGSTDTEEYLYDDDEDDSLFEGGTSQELTPSLYPPYSAKTRQLQPPHTSTHSSSDEDEESGSGYDSESETSSEDVSSRDIDSNESEAGTETETSCPSSSEQHSKGNSTKQQQVQRPGTADTLTGTTITLDEDSLGLDFNRQLALESRDKPHKQQQLNDQSTSDGFTFDRSRNTKTEPDKRDNTLDETTETWEEDTLDVGRKNPHVATIPAKKRRQMLFIQMEYCPRTLRDVLDGDGLKEPGRWSALRQLLAGLQHIHAQGIIHRDLKPANLFYDAKNELKLGDFGLAKFNASDPDELEEVSQRAPASVEPYVNLSDTTGVCGTSFYIDPASERGLYKDGYDERVDIFSLGIIVFELWRPFSTAMERAVILRDLREKGIIPGEFEKQNPTVTKLIRWMLAPNPADRPTAREVLRSELLPPTVGDEELEDLLRSLPDNPAVHDKVLDQLFALGSADNYTAAPLRAVSPVTAVDFPRTAGAPIADTSPPEVRQRIVETLREKFNRHGAVPMTSYEVGLATSELPDDSAVDVLSRGGSKLALRGELRRPFAAWLAAQAASGVVPVSEGLRRWEIAQVYHKGRSSAALPRSLVLADFDIIAPVDGGGGGQPLAEAEALSAVVNAIDSLPELSARWEVRVGHRALADAAMANAGVPRELRPAALQLLTAVANTSPRHSATRTARWSSLRQGLDGLGLSKESIDRCKRFVLQGAGEALGALHWLGSTLGTGSHHHRHTTSSSAFLLEMKSLLSLLSTLGVPGSRITVDPFLSPQAGYYEGLLLQVHLVTEDTNTSSASSVPIAVGGRYDGLLKAYWARQAALTGLDGPPPALCAVGMTVSVDRLVSEVVAVVDSGGVYQRTTTRAPGTSPWRLSTSDVLVCSRGGGGLLSERMVLLKTLWDAGIASETMLVESPSMQQQYSYATSRNIPWLVVISKASFSATDTVRVKSLHSRIEEDVAVSELAKFLHTSLQPHMMSGRMTPIGLRSTTGEEESEDSEEEPAVAKQGRRGGRGNRKERG